MEKGDLVPDDVVVKIVAERVDQPDCKNGVILDGFPRTLAQAAALDHVLAGRNKRLDAVIELRVDDNSLVERIVGRFTCAKCGHGYHDRFKRPKIRGVCDVCGGTEFVRRPDDNAETVTKRLMIYYRETSPLIGYYFCKGIMKSVDGMAPIDQVTQEIGALLKGLK
jgi:adenylate kinase